MQLTRAIGKMRLFIKREITGANKTNVKEKPKLL